MNKQIKETYLEGRLIRIEPRQIYGTIDVDTWRDGYWELPEPCWERLVNFLKSYQLFPFDISPSGLTAYRVPLVLIEEVARRMAEILAPFRPKKKK